MTSPTRGRVVIMNDTSGRYHHGCSRVMRLLRAGLARHGLTVTYSLASRKAWDDDAKFWAAVKDADLIVINGEGTLHHGKPAAEALLRIATHPQRRGTPIALINALYEENPEIWGKYLQHFALIAARDSESARALARASKQGVRWLPDLSLSAPAKVPAATHRAGVLLGDSVRMTSRQALARAARHLPKATYLPTKTLRHPVWHSRATRRLARTLLFAAYNGSTVWPQPRFDMSPDESAYLSRLASAELHITGRFHAVCLSLLTETPFLALGSNASKIERLLTDAGLPKDRMITPEALVRPPPRRPFSTDELETLRRFRASAVDKADQLFADLARLAGQHV